MKAILKKLATPNARKPLRNLFEIPFWILFLTGPVQAQSSLDVSQVKCAKGWIRADSDKFQVLSFCGEAQQVEVISGDTEPKTERLMYQVKNKHYVIWLRNGRVTKIEYLRS